jgi:predicted GIY-YIG superfamily endonuclease
VPQFWVYILRCSDGSLYTGTTTDVRRRVGEHNSGRGAKYTRSRLPTTLAYLEKAESLREALIRELEIKKLSRSSKLLLCASNPARLRQSSR